MATNKRHHILGSFDENLQELRGGLMDIGALVEKQLAACSALLEERPGQAAAIVNQVINREGLINQQELKVFDGIISFFCRHQPVASDMRRGVSYLRMCTDLERIGDELEHVALNLGSLKQGDALQGKIGEVLRSLLKMDTAALARALQALASEDRQDAQRVIDRDAEINARQSTLEKAAVEGLKQNRLPVESCLLLIQVARSLERVGDHAKNIAQAMIYSVTGDDPRSSEVAGKAKRKAMKSSARSGKDKDQ